MTLPKRVAGVALAVGFVCLILWALAPRGFLFGHEAPSEWEYHPPANAVSASHAAPAAAAAPDVSLPQPGNASSLPDTTGTENAEHSGSAAQRNAVQRFGRRCSARCPATQPQECRAVRSGTIATCWGWGSYGTGSGTPTTETSGQLVRTQSVTSVGESECGFSRRKSPRTAEPSVKCSSLRYL